MVYQWTTADLERWGQGMGYDNLKAGDGDVDIMCGLTVHGDLIVSGSVTSTGGSSGGGVDLAQLHAIALSL